MEYKVDIGGMQKADVPQALEAVEKAFQDGRQQKVKGARRRLHSRVVDGRQAKLEIKEAKVCRTATTVRCYL